MNRSEVYRLIDGERDYQDQMIKPDPSRTNVQGLHSVGEFLVMADTYLDRAKRGWTEEAGDHVALDNIRKLAAICVTCMEQNGGVQR